MAGPPRGLLGGWWCGGGKAASSLLVPRAEALRRGGPWPSRQAERDDHTCALWTPVGGEAS